MLGYYSQLYCSPDGPMNKPPEASHPASQVSPSVLITVEFN